MTFKYENKKIAEGYTHIIGCDEVGRGCLAGPVVAAAVMLSKVESLQAIKSAGIRDSKLLNQAQREKADVIIKQNFLWSIGIVSQEMVDRVNIHNASLLAMHKAASGLLSGVIPDLSLLGQSPSIKQLKSGILILVDGKFTIPKLNMEQEAIIDGDNKVLSIAAASIIAKVFRDKLMVKLHNKYPVYNFAQHKGYATEHHRKMILNHGLSPLHRLSFCQDLSI